MVEIVVALLALWVALIVIGLAVKAFFWMVAIGIGMLTLTAVYGIVKGPWY